jgi:hypothetical protein
MRYAEVNVCGVFVSPLAVMLPAAWLLFVILRRVAHRAGLVRQVWHPALASLAVFVMVVSALVVGVGSLP